MGVSFNSHNFSTVDPMPKFFLENYRFNPKFHWGPNLSFFGLGPWYRQIGIYFYLSNINFDGTI